MKSFKAMLGIVIAALSVAGEARAEHTRVTNPSALSVEALGRGVAWSVNFDRVVSDELAAGIGFGALSLDEIDFGTGEDSITATAIPMYVNYYFTRDAGSLFVTGGVTAVFSSGNSGDSNYQSPVGGIRLKEDGILPTAGIGYENRGDFGFLLRIAGYGLFAEEVAAWGGFTFGYAF